MSLGERIQDLRQRRELTTRELAARVGVTSAMISQIEHERTSPSLDTLRRIATALETRLPYLLQEDDLAPEVTRKADRHVIQLGESGLHASILSPIPQRGLELVLLQLPPGKISWAKSRSHEGLECHVVLKGTIRAYHGEKSYLLHEGDSILWDGTVPHRMENVGKRTAQLMIALTPPAFLPLERFTGADAGERRANPEQGHGEAVREQARGKAGRRSSSKQAAPLQQRGRRRIER